MILVGEREIPVQVRRLENAKLNAAIDAAYAAKYRTKANRPYVEGFATPRRRARTLELAP